MHGGDLPRKRREHPNFSSKKVRFAPCWAEYSKSLVSGASVEEAESDSMGLRVQYQEHRQKFPSIIGKLSEERGGQGWRLLAKWVELRFEGRKLFDIKKYRDILELSRTVGL
jgi:hypothetical protein